MKTLTLIMGILLLSTSLIARQHKKTPSLPIQTQAPRFQFDRADNSENSDSGSKGLASQKFSQISGRISLEMAAPKSASMMTAQCRQEFTVEALSRITSFSMPQSRKGGGLYFLMGNPAQIHAVLKPLSPPSAVTQFESGVSAYGVSLDGKKIWAIAGNGSLHVLFPIDKTAQRLSTAKEYISSASWDPESKWLAFTGNRRNGNDLDLYRYDLGKGVTQALTELEGFNRIFDIAPNRQQIALGHFTSYHTSTLVLWDDHKKQLSLIKPKEGSKFGSAFFTPNSSALITLSDHASGVAQLFHLSLKTKRFKRLIQLTGPVDGITTDKTRTQIAYTVNLHGYGILERAVLSGNSLLPQGVSTDAQSVIQTPQWITEKSLAFIKSASGKPPQIVSVEGSRETIWIKNAEVAGKNCFIPESLVTYPSLDGKSISGFWYPSSDSAVIYIHDGPADQFRPVFHPWISYLNARDFSVLALNVRGSEGFTNAFSKADDGPKRTSSFDDIRAASGWLAQKKGIKKVFALGEGYGGFAALCTADAFSGVISFVGRDPYISMGALPIPMKALAHAEFDGEITRNLSNRKERDETRVLLIGGFQTSDATLLKSKRIDERPLQGSQLIEAMPLISHFLEQKKGP